MAHVNANGIQIEYETFGRNTDPTIVLIAGNGAQLNFWEPDFCEMLAKHNLQVIRFDNCDAGLSTKFDAAGIPDMKRIYQAAKEGKPIKTAYTFTGNPNNPQISPETLAIVTATPPTERDAYIDYTFKYNCHSHICLLFYQIWNAKWYLVFG
jgi:pimeloyl-ACP methyl ester carboxylesterase